MRYLFALRLFSGLVKSMETGQWRPGGVPAVFKLMEYMGRERIPRRGFRVFLQDRERGKDLQTFDPCPLPGDPRRLPHRPLPRPGRGKRHDRRGGERLYPGVLLPPAPFRETVPSGVCRPGKHQAGFSEFALGNPDSGPKAFWESPISVFSRPPDARDFSPPLPIWP